MGIVTSTPRVATCDKYHRRVMNMVYLSVENRFYLIRGCPWVSAASARNRESTS